MKIEDLIKEYKQSKVKRDYPITISFEHYLLFKILEEIQPKHSKKTKQQKGEKTIV